MSKPTINEVAERAGVSKSLVSLVMRGAPNVSDGKREEVLKAASELGYRPNAVARSLVEGRTRVIGVMLSDLHNPFFAEVVDGIEAEASRRGYRALMSSGQRVPAREQEAIETFLDLRTDGVIVAGPSLPTQPIVAASRSAPVVVVGRTMRSPSVDSVTDDDRMGAELAVDHLASLGHRRIACIDGGRAAGAEPRRRGYRRGMLRLGLSAQVQVVPGAFTEEGGYQGMKGLLGLKVPPTAICAANDLAAIGAMNAIEERGLAVPLDVSVVGYDNTALAALRHVQLTTINQPRFEIGAQAVAVLLERIEQGRTTPRRVLLPPSLVIRDTTGPPGES
ncbi:MAG: LacI family transcriptional regulator [Actinomycetota bacterium]|nr:LacI family transcriptional regulator [Actinomycetota bacterium]